jgi:4-carboxymuconolactone decarboxylase
MERLQSSFNLSEALGRAPSSRRRPEKFASMHQRIPSLPDDEVASRLSYTGQIPNLRLLRTLAHAPSVCDLVIRLGGAILNRTRLDPQLRELAVLRVAHARGSSYELAHHERIGESVGLGRDAIATAGGEVAQYVGSDSERLILAFCDELIEFGRPADSTFNILSELLGIEQVTELTITIGYYMMIACFLETAGLTAADAREDSSIRFR